MDERRPKPPTVRARATVLAAENTTPRMRRLTVGGPEVRAFLGTPGVDGAAAWVKVFEPQGEGRAYTIRRTDRAAGTLELDFVLHGDQGPAGPVSTWAEGARVGDVVQIAGPRQGGFACPAATQWVLLAGDATALPAIQSIARSLPQGMAAKAYVEVASPEEAQPMESAAPLRTHWIMADTAQPGLALQHALMFRPLPPGPGYAWLAGESGAVRALRDHLQTHWGAERLQVSAKGYWKAGQRDFRNAD